MTRLLFAHGGTGKRLKRESVLLMAWLATQKKKKEKQKKRLFHIDSFYFIAIHIHKCLLLS